MDIALQHVNLVTAVGSRIDRMHAQGRPLGLQHAPQVFEAFSEFAGDDDCLDLRVGEQFFEVPGNSQGRPIAPPALRLRRRRRPDAARCRERSRHPPTVRVFAENREAHQ